MNFPDDFEHDIIMHCEVHFGGRFEEMLSYYANEDNLGINPDFSYSQITALAAYAQKTGENLFETLEVDEKEKVRQAKLAYQNFKSLYEQDNPTTPYPRLIADLILTENPLPTAEIATVVACGKPIIPLLLALLNLPEAYDPLFPGYGFAPFFAVKALEQLRDPQAIAPLFEMLKNEFVFEEESILSALHAHGAPAKTFLLNRLESRPLNRDNLDACRALAYFADDPEVRAAAARELVASPNPLYRDYLLCLLD